ncbi:hypothetical protein EVA_21066 [gut metagenome]|uniref:Uncharacterized protein n=1 Tax=gut metagenome TaxID=749906 RepID=J9BTE0_9ZZZZ
MVLLSGSIRLNFFSILPSKTRSGQARVVTFTAAPSATLAMSFS